MTNAVIDNFIKKVKLAQTTKSKDIRFTIEEATDLVSAIASINNSTDEILKLSKKVDRLVKAASEAPTTTTPHIDGGGFKS